LAIISPALGVSTLLKAAMTLARSASSADDRVGASAARAVTWASTGSRNCAAIMAASER
jgi:hypothetical protein